MKDEQTGKYVGSYSGLKINPRPLSFRLPNVLKDVLIKEAAKQNCDMSHLVRQALAQKFFLENRLSPDQVWTLMEAKLLSDNFKNELFDALLNEILLE